MFHWISSLRRWLASDYGLGLGLGLLFVASTIFWQFSGRGNILGLALVGSIGAAILLQWPIAGALYISFSLFASMASILPGIDTAIAVLTLLSYGFRRLLKGNLSWRFPASARWAILLIAWLAASITWAESTEKGIEMLIMYLKSFLIFFLMLEAARNHRWVVNLIYAGLAGVIFSTATSAYTGYRFFFGGSAAELAQVVAVGKTRLFGLWFDPNYFALALLVFLGIAFGLWRTRLTLVARSFAAIGFASVIIGIVLTLSRAAIISALIALALCLWIDLKRVRILFFVCTVVTLVLFVLPVNLGERFETLTTAAGDASIHQRGQLLSGGIQMAIDTFPFGVGLGNYFQHSLAYAKLSGRMLSHNSYLDLAAEGGILALLLYAALILSLIHATRVPRFRLDPGSLSNNLTIGMRISLIASFIGAAFLSAAVFEPLWWLAGIIAAKAACDAELEKQETQAPIVVRIA